MPTYNDILNVMYTVTAADLEELEQTALSYQYNAEAWAVGKRNNVDVASTDPTYHNNSKWYSQQAGNSATSAREDAELAGRYAEAAATATLAIYPRPFEDLLASNGEPLLASDGGHIYADALSINDSSVAIQHLQEKELLQDQNITSARVYAKSLYDSNHDFAQGLYDSNHDFAQGLYDANHDFAQGLYDSNHDFAQGLYDANHDFAQGLYDTGVALMEAGDADLQSQIDATSVAIQHLQEKEVLQDQNITSARDYAKSLYDSNHDFAQGLYDAAIVLMEAGDVDLQSQIDATNNLLEKRHDVLLASDGTPLQTSSGEDLLIDIFSWMEFSVAVQRLQEVITSLTDRVKTCEMHISSVLKRL